MYVRLDDYEIFTARLLELTGFDLYNSECRLGSNHFGLLDYLFAYTLDEETYHIIGVVKAEACLHHYVVEQGKGITYRKFHPYQALYRDDDLIGFTWHEDGETFIMMQVQLGSDTVAYVSDHQTCLLPADPKTSYIRRPVWWRRWYRGITKALFSKKKFSDTY